MRNMVAAALMAGVLLPLAGAAHAADLDYSYEPPRPPVYLPPPPPPVAYRPLIVRPVPVARLYPRPWLRYGPRVYPRPYFPGPVVRAEPRPDFEGRPYPPREIGRVYPREDREGYGRPYARDYREGREDDQRRFSREDDRRSRDYGREDGGARGFGREDGRPRGGFGREDGHDYARGGYGRDDRYADRRDLPPRGDYER